MSFTETAPRYRINADQGRDNVWSFNATAEDKDIHLVMSNNPEDPGDTVHEPMGLKLLTLIKETEDIFRDDGRVLISDGIKRSLSPPKSYNKDKKTTWYAEKMSEATAYLNQLTLNNDTFVMSLKKPKS